MQYVKECLQLLYWIYFKPYTLNRHVRAICPEITNPYSDSFLLRSVEARANPRLKRYDDQCWWLAALVPVAIVFLCGPLAQTAAMCLSSGLRFSWYRTSLFLTGWLLGQLIVRAIRRKLGEKTTWLVIGAAMVLILASFFLLKQFVAESLLRGAAFGMAAGVAFGVMFSVMFSVAAGVVLGVMVGVAEGVAVSMVEGVAAGVMVGVFCILGVLLRIYFWLPELLWMFFITLWPRPAAAKLPCLPPRFDQLIILPLPFLPGIIAEAYQENQAAARQTISYLISSTNQQKTAGKAMLLIAAESFSRCGSAKEIAAVRAQLDWLPAELAGKITACLELSQDTAAALEASSPYRQEERLKQVCGKLVRLRNSLADASAREATALGSVLDHWLRLLETEQRTLREAARRSEEIPQVYLPGPPLEPDKAGSLFKGRRDLFRQIESLILSAQPPTLVLHGGRRSGKSSALRYLPKQMPSDILPLFVDCQHLADVLTLSGFAGELADQLIRSARQSHRLTLPQPDRDELARDPFVALRHWMDAVEQAADGKTLLVCLDEFERIEEIVTATGSRAPLNFLRHLIQHRSRWTLLFAGAHTPEELSPHWSDCLINTRSLRVSCLDKDDAMELIRRPVEDFPDIWQEDAAEAVWQLTQGQPFLIQLLCQEAVDHLNRKKAKTVQVSDVEAVIPAAFEHGHYYFDEFQRALTDGQRELLRALAKREQITPDTAADAPVLVRKEVLVQENGGWLFRVPLLGRWIAGKGYGCGE
jgi:AAA+ ATPase superfamily predicted ATPase